MSLTKSLLDNVSKARKIASKSPIEAIKILFNQILQQIFTEFCSILEGWNRRVIDNVESEINTLIDELEASLAKDPPLIQLGIALIPFRYRGLLLRAFENSFMEIPVDEKKLPEHKRSSFLLKELANSSLNLLESISISELQEQLRKHPLISFSCLACIQTWSQVNSDATRTIISSLENLESILAKGKDVWFAARAVELYIANVGFEEALLIKENRGIIFLGIFTKATVL